MRQSWAVEAKTCSSDSAEYIARMIFVLIKSQVDDSGNTLALKDPEVPSAYTRRRCFAHGKRRQAPEHNTDKYGNGMFQNEYTHMIVLRTILAFSEALAPIRLAMRANSPCASARCMPDLVARTHSNQECPRAAKRNWLRMLVLQSQPIHGAVCADESPRPWQDLNALTRAMPHALEA